MSVFIQFLLDHMAFVVITGIVVVAILAISAILIVMNIRGKKKLGKEMGIQETEAADRLK